jgi:hypothetical protein
MIGYTNPQMMGFMEHQKSLERYGLVDAEKYRAASRTGLYCPHCGIARMPHLFCEDPEHPDLSWPRRCPECKRLVHRPYLWVPDEFDERPWTHFFKAWGAAFPDQALTLAQVERAVYSTLRDSVPT